MYFCEIYRKPSPSKKGRYRKNKEKKAPLGKFRSVLMVPFFLYFFCEFFYIKTNRSIPYLLIYFIAPFKIIMLLCIMSINDEELIDALENDTNSSIIKLNTQKILEHKNNILQTLQLDRDTLKQYHKKLKPYRYCSDVNDFVPGQYVRWINLKDPNNIKLTNGAFLVDIIFESNKLHMLCKNRYSVFQVKYDEVIVFQKLSQQEHVILTVMDYLEK